MIRWQNGGSQGHGAADTQSWPPPTMACDACVGHNGVNEFHGLAIIDRLGSLVDLIRDHPDSAGHAGQ